MMAFLTMAFFTMAFFMMAFFTMAFITIAFFTIAFIKMAFFTMAFSETHRWCYQIQEFLGASDQEKGFFYSEAVPVFLALRVSYGLISLATLILFFQVQFTLK